MVVAGAALAALGATGAAQAACVLQPSATVTCTGGSYGALDLQNEVIGDQPDLVLILEPGVNIVTQPGERDGVAIEQAGDLTVTTSGNVSITVSADAGTPDRDGIRVDSIDGGIVTVTSTANITADDEEGDGIVARSNAADNEAGPNWGDLFKAMGTGNVFVASSGVIEVHGDVATGITAGGAGDVVSVTVSGDITTTGATESTAIVAQNYEGVSNPALLQTDSVATINVQGADLSTSGSLSAGISAGNVKGRAVVNTVGGTVTTTGYQSVGIGAASGLADLDDLTSGNPLILTSIGDVIGTGVAINNGTAASAGNDGMTVTTTGDWGFGIIGYSKGGAIDILNRGWVSTSGDVAAGVAAMSLYAPSSAKGGVVTIDNRATISTGGDASAGIFALALGSDISVISSGAITTTGGTVAVPELAALGVPMNSSGIQAVVQSIGPFAPGYGDVGVTTTATGTIDTSGDLAHGIEARASLGKVTVTAAGDIETRGDGADGINAISAAPGMVGNDGSVTADVTANVTASGAGSSGIRASGSRDVMAITDRSVMGGWGASAWGVSLLSTAASGQSLSLYNAGRVGALSDQAVSAGGDGSNDALINNQGTITGFVVTGKGNDQMLNLSPMSFDMRNFADTDGDGVRDREAVAASDFGAGIDSFSNGANGVVRLLSVPGATVVGTGQYAPAGHSGHDIGAVGVEQAHLLNLETFSNAGMITLWDTHGGGASPVAGDVVVISGGATAGSDGGGVFVSQGGSLYLDTVLDEGGANSLSDVLVVDSTTTGAGGATRIFVANAGGAGGSTDTNGNGVVDAGEGILVVEVLDDAASATDAFTLGGPVIAGAYAYALTMGPTDKDWYLVNTLSPTVDVYAPYAGTLLGYGRQSIGTFADRVGRGIACDIPRDDDERLPDDDERDEYCREDQQVWGRVEAGGFFQNGGADVDQLYALMQGGVESLVHRNQDGDFVASVFGTWGLATARVGDEAGAEIGTGTTEAFSLAGSLSWLGKSGLYVDAVAQGTIYSSDLAAGALGELVSDNLGFGYAFSLEAGQRIDLGRVTLVPQGQLIWSRASFDSFTDPFGAVVTVNAAESLRGRLGLAAESGRTWETEEGETRSLTGRGIVNLYHEFLDGPTTNVAEVQVTGTGTGSELEFGAGLNYALEEDVEFFGEASMSTTLSSGSGYGWSASLGVKGRF